MASSLVLPAYAKINLFLHVGKKNSIGYHELKTIFQEVSLADTLTLSIKKDRISLTTDDPMLPTDKSNFVVKALTLLQKTLKTKMGAQVHLKKNIPMQAGLGGGSSDAATALIGGYILWKKPRATFDQIRKAPPPVLLQCAKKLGADMSFFLYGGRAFADGVGDRIWSLPKSPKEYLLLVYPNVPVSTKEAYQWLDDFAASEESQNGNGTPANSFEPIVLKKFPEINKAYVTLKKLKCNPVMLSGSGASVFGFVPTLSEGEKLQRLLKTVPWKSFLVHTL